MLRRIVTVVFIAIILIVLTIHFTGKAILVGKIEQSVAEKLQDKIGRAQSYKVRADGDLGDMVKGRLKTLHIMGNNVLLPNGITVDKLNIDAKSIVFNIKQSTISAVKQTRFTASVSQDKLNEFVAKSYPNISKPQIVLTDGKLLIHADPRFAGRSLPVYAEGTVWIDKGTRLVIDLKKFHASGFSMPGLARRSLERKLNPLLDVSTWAFPAKLTSAVISSGMMTVTGSADLAPR